MDGPGHSPQNQEQALSAIHQKKRSCLMSAVAGMMFAVQTNRGGSGISSVSAMLSVVPLSVVYIDGYGPYKSLCYLCEDAVLLCAVFTQEPLATASAACLITTATASLIFPDAVVMIPLRTVVVTIIITYYHGAPLMDAVAVVCRCTVLPRKSGPSVSPNIRVRNTVVSGYLGCLHSKNSGKNQHHQKGSEPSLRLKMYGSGFEALDAPCVLSGSTFDSVEVRSELHF